MDWRFLQQEGQCVRTQGFTTAYNGDQRVPPYQGIMFEVAATSAIQVTTLEFDVRLDQVARNDDLIVEAFVAEAGYLGIMDDPSGWVRVARGKLELLGGTTAAISKADFQSFSMRPGQRRSIYISLLTGSYFDHTVNALDKTGELAAENNDLKIYVGTGFHGPSFRSLPDTVLDPQFAGTVRYETTVPCSSLVRETTVSLAFVVELSEASNPFARLSFLLAEAMGKVLDDLLRNHNGLSDFVDEFRLKRRKQVATNQADFTESWRECPALYHEVDLQLEHADALDSGKVLQFVYGAISDFEAQATEVVNQLVEGRHAYYVGQALTDVPFTMKLEGPKVGVPMTVVQADYFSDQMLSFIVSSKGQTPIQIFDVSVEGQVSAETGAIRRLAGDSTEIVGRIFGTAPVGFSEEYFGAAVANSFDLYPGNFLQLLKTEGAKPSVLDARSFAVFRDLESATATIEVLDAPYLQPKAESTKSLVYFIIMGVFGGLTVLIGSFKFSKYRIKKARDDEERRIYREKMRQERQEKRIERSQSREELISVDGTTDLSMWDEINAESESCNSSDSKTSSKVDPKSNETSELPERHSINEKDSPKRKPNEAPSLPSFLGESTHRQVPASSQSLSGHIHGSTSPSRAPPLRCKSDIGAVTGQTEKKLNTVVPSFEKTNRFVERSKSSDVLGGAFRGKSTTRQEEPSKERFHRGVGRSKSSDGLGHVLPMPPVRRSNDDLSVASLPNRPEPGQIRTLKMEPLNERRKRGVGRSLSSDGLGDVMPKLPVRQSIDDRSVASVPLRPLPGHPNLQAVESSSGKPKRGVGRSMSSDGFSDVVPKLPVRHSTADGSVASIPKRPPPRHPNSQPVESSSGKPKRGVGRSMSSDGLSDVMPKLPVRHTTDDRSVASVPKRPQPGHPNSQPVAPLSRKLTRGVGRSMSSDGVGDILPTLPVRHSTGDRSEASVPLRPLPGHLTSQPVKPSSGSVKPKRGVGRSISTDGVSDVIPKLPVRRSNDTRSTANEAKPLQPGQSRTLQMEPSNERCKRGIGRSISSDDFGDVFQKHSMNASTIRRPLESQTPSSTPMQKTTSEESKIFQHQQSISKPASKKPPRRHHSSAALLSGSVDKGLHDCEESSFRSRRTNAVAPTLHKTNVQAEGEKSTLESKQAGEVCPGALHSPGSSTGTASLQDGVAGKNPYKTSRSVDLQTSVPSEDAVALSENLLRGGYSPQSKKSDRKKLSDGSPGNQGLLDGNSLHSTKSPGEMNPRSTKAPHRRRGLTRSTSSSVLGSVGSLVDESVLKIEKSGLSQLHTSKDQLTNKNDHPCEEEMLPCVANKQDSSKRRGGLSRSTSSREIVDTSKVPSSHEKSTQNRRKGLSRTMSSSVLKIDTSHDDDSGNTCEKKMPSSLLVNDQTPTNRRGALTRSTSSRVCGVGGGPPKRDDHPKPEPQSTGTRIGRRGGLARSMSSRHF